MATLKKPTAQEKRVKAAREAQKSRGLKLGQRADGGSKVFWKEHERTPILDIGARLVSEGKGRLGRRHSLPLLRLAQAEALASGQLEAHRSRRIIAISKEKWFLDGVQQQLDDMAAARAREEAAAQRAEAAARRAEEKAAAQRAADEQAAAAAAAATPPAELPAIPATQARPEQGFTLAREIADTTEELLVGFLSRQGREMAINEILAICKGVLKRLVAEVMDERQENSRRFMTTPASAVKASDGGEHPAPSAATRSTTQEPARPSVEDLRPPVEQVNGQPMSAREAAIENLVTIGRMPRDVAERIYEQQQKDREAKRDDDDSPPPANGHKNGNGVDIDQVHARDHNDDGGPEDVPPPRHRHNPEMPPSMPQEKQPRVLVVGLTGRQRDDVIDNFKDRVQLRFHLLTDDPKRLPPMLPGSDKIISTGHIAGTLRDLIRIRYKDKFEELPKGQLVNGVERVLNEYLSSPDLEDLVAANRAAESQAGRLAQHQHHH